MDIIVEKIDEEEREERGISLWPIWEKEISEFDWSYDSTEECYLLEGEVVVTPANGEPVSFGKGDFVTFKRGLLCKWDIKKAVKKHYNFK